MLAVLVFRGKGATAAAWWAVGGLVALVLGQILVGLDMGLDWMGLPSLPADNAMAGLSVIWLGSGLGWTPHPDRSGQVAVATSLSYRPFRHLWYSSETGGPVGELRGWVPGASLRFRLGGKK